MGGGKRTGDLPPVEVDHEAFASAREPKGVIGCPPRFVDDVIEPSPSATVES